MLQGAYQPRIGLPESADRAASPVDWSVVWVQALFCPGSRRVSGVFTVANVLLFRVEESW